MRPQNDWSDLAASWRTKNDMQVPSLETIRRLERRQRRRLALVIGLQALITVLVSAAGLELWRWHRDPLSLSWLAGCGVLVASAWIMSLGKGHWRAVPQDEFIAGDLFIAASIARCRKRLKATGLLLLLLFGQTTALVVWGVLRAAEISSRGASPELWLRVSIGAVVTVGLGAWLAQLRIETSRALSRLEDLDDSTTAGS